MQGKSLRPQIVHVPGNRYAHLTTPRDRKTTVCLMDHNWEPAADGDELCPFCSRDTRLAVK